MNTRAFLFAIVTSSSSALALSACDETPPPLYGSVQTTTADAGMSAPAIVHCDPAFAMLGVPVDDRPSYQERLALYAADRGRAEPAKTGWPKYPAVPPLLWHDQLAQAARAHSQDMRDTPCFQHPSCDGTDTFVRIMQFFKQSASSMGENIAAGVNDGITVVEQSWIDEKGAAPGETGHRDNMFDSGFQLVGFGYLSGGTQFQGYWTQDFAGLSVKQPPLAAGSHFPQTPGANLPATFGVVFYQANGTAPDQVAVYVDDKPTTLALARGTESLGAYEQQVAVPAGCHRYRFVATIAGATSCYPGSGTLGISPDGADCSEWVADQ